MSAQIRRAEDRDLKAIARLAGELVRQHHAFDSKRFLLVDDVERGYEHWFRRELGRTEAVILAVEQGTQIVGYAYARLEERDWNALLDEHAALHDIFIAESARGTGLGASLLDAVVRAVHQQGARLMVLHTAAQNAAAQRLFARRGFRTSMLEMTLDVKQPE